MYYFTGGNAPFICGGDNGPAQGIGEYTDSCYRYIAESDEWELSGTMGEDRAYSGYGSSNSWGLIMAGGVNTQYLPTVVTTTDGDIFGSLPNLPDTNTQSCLVIIDDDRLFTCGGYFESLETFIFSKLANSWRRYSSGSFVVPFIIFLFISAWHLCLWIGTITAAD